MKVCPSCREEYLDHIETCSPCESKLISEEEASKLPAPQAGMSKEELLKGETVPLLEGNLDSCREIEFNLSQEKIPCAVYPINFDTSEEISTQLSFNSMKYVVLVAPSSVDRCKEVLQSHFKNQVAMEGKGDFVKDAVDLESSDAACPACGQAGGFDDGECGGCGLYLGGED